MRAEVCEKATSPGPVDKLSLSTSNLANLLLDSSVLSIKSNIRSSHAAPRDGYGTWTPAPYSLLASLPSIPLRRSSCMGGGESGTYLYVSRTWRRTGEHNPTWSGKLPRCFHVTEVQYVPVYTHSSTPCSGPAYLHTRCLFFFGLTHVQSDDPVPALSPRKPPPSFSPQPRKQLHAD